MPLKSEKPLGTVGAVACDSNDRLAAATSTGGMTNKKFGRIGDTALIGLGAMPGVFTREIIERIMRIEVVSIYVREPNHILFELASEGPGFTVDGPLDGERLSLPPFLEHRRAEIEARLKPL